MIKLTDILLEGEYWGNAGAGILPYAINTKRFLMSLRSGEVYEPHTWSLWGGKVEGGENVAEAAEREFREETGYSKPINLVKSYIFKDPKEDFKYTNFVGIIENEFIPKLDWETQSYKWVTYTQLEILEPKHLGFKKFFINNTILKRLPH